MSDLRYYYSYFSVIFKVYCGLVWLALPQIVYRRETHVVNLTNLILKCHVDALDLGTPREGLLAIAQSDCGDALAAVGWHIRRFSPWQLLSFIRSWELK